MYRIGIDIGGTKINIGLFDDENKKITVTDYIKIATAAVLLIIINLFKVTQIYSCHMYYLISSSICKCASNLFFFTIATIPAATKEIAERTIKPTHQPN